MVKNVKKVDRYASKQLSKNSNAEYLDNHNKITKIMELGISFLKQLTEKNRIYIFIFIIYFIPRIIDIGTDIYNFDAILWYERGPNFIEAILTGNLTETYQQYHPGVTLMWITGIPLTVYKYLFELKFGFSPFLYANHFRLLQISVLLPLMTVYAFIGTALFHYLKRLTNIKYSIIFSILLSLEPFYLGISRFLHVTGLLAIFSVLSTIILLNYIKEQKNRDLIIFSIVTGFAMLTKINAIVFWGLNILVLFGFYIFIKKDKINAFKNTVKSGLITVGTYILLWPTMWVNPIETIQKIINDGVLKTAIEDNAETPIKSLLGLKYLYYTEINFYRLSGLLTILIISSIFLYLYKRKQINIFLAQNIWLKNLLFIALIYYFVYYISLSIPTKLKDRYIVVYIPYLVLIASLTYYYLLEIFSYKLKKILIVSTILYYLFIGWVNYPVYSFYYSELLGGAKGITSLGYNVINRGEYYIQAANYLNSIEGVNPESLNVISYGGSIIITFEPAFQGKAINKAGFLLDNEDGDYWLSLYEHLDYVPYDYCTLEKTFGPRWPLQFNILNLYECKGIDNTYRDPKAD